MLFRSDFVGAYASEAECFATIKGLFEDCGYVIDTHTAIAAAARKKQADLQTKTFIASTASPYKFVRSVMNAIDPKYDAKSDFELIDELAKISNTSIPKAIEEIKTAPVLHNTVCEVDEMKQEVCRILNI